MSALNQTATIQVALIEHSVIILPGLGATRCICRCGWRHQENSERDAQAATALHQAEHITDALNRLSDDIVDAELAI